MTTSTKPEWWTTDHWSTPPEIVRGLEAEFGAFTLDPCCTAITAKAPTFYTPETDGLSKPWSGNVFLNPPYSKPGPWLRKAREETESGRARLVVALLPVSTDTRWFHDYVRDVAELRFVRGRIKFFGWMGTPIGSPKQPSMLAIYRAPEVKDSCI